MNNRSYLGIGVILCYLLSALGLLVALGSFSKTTYWISNDQVIASMVAGFGFASFFAVIGGTVILGMLQAGINPWANEEREYTATDNQVVPQDATVKCPACATINVKKRTECWTCGTLISPAEKQDSV